MSDISDRINAHITIADFVNIDAIGKANLIGAGIRIFAMPPGREATDPFGVLISLESPTALDESPAFELVLTTSTGQVVTAPGPDGRTQAIRVSMNVDFQSPSVPGVKIPAGSVPSMVQFAINFSNGLPLRAGYSYQFRVQIDHDVVGSYSFFVSPLAPPMPVVG